MSDPTLYTVDVDPHRPNNAHAFTIDLVGTGHRVLELGCWTGHVTEHLVAAGNRVVGVEVDPAAAELARRFADTVHVLDLDRTPVASVEAGPFDVIVAGDVLEHLRDPDAVLAGLVDLLAPGGRMVLSLPHVAHADVRLMLLEGVWRYQPDGLLDRTHLRWFTRESIAELLRGAGLVATEVRRVRVPVGGTNVPVTPGLHGPEVLAFVAADPEADTLQFVLAARRVGPGVDDALDAPPVRWPDAPGDQAALEVEVAALREANAALADEVAAWRRSRLVRLTAPLRALRSRVRAGGRR